MACAENEVELADRLLTLGAVVDFENQRGHTALSWACVCGADKVAELLLTHGADPKRKSKLEERVPLAHAAQHGHAAVIELLLHWLAPAPTRCGGRCVLFGGRFDCDLPM